MLLVRALLGLSMLLPGSCASLPVVVNTWPFVNATAAAYDVLVGSAAQHRLAVSAVEVGCSTCEQQQCDGTVGYGGSPDEGGETTLDAMVMDGTTMEAGAVSSLRFIKQAARAARLVLEHTRHTMLAGMQATQFAVGMGLASSSLTTPHSAVQHDEWLANRCQPNFRKHVLPSAAESCGPYLPDGTDQPHAELLDKSRPGDGPQFPSHQSHDTLAMVAVDAEGNVAAGCSSNGAIHKVPGRVGDCSTPGAGAYADSEVGGCGSTGDGDVHLRFQPCFHVVESMRSGMAPQEACEAAVRRIARRVQGYVGAVVAVNRDGQHGAAAHGWTFSYAHASPSTGGRARVVQVDPIGALDRIHIFQRIAKLWLPWYVLAFVYRAPILDAHAGFRHDRMRPEFVGLLLQVASTFFATCMGMVAKVAARRGIPVLEIVFMRSMVLLVLAMGMLRWRGERVRDYPRKGLLLLRGLMGFAAVSAFYWSVTLLPLSDVASLGFLSPLGVALAAPCLLGEPASRAALAAVPVALVGVALVAQPTFLFGDGAALPAAGIAVGLLQALLVSAAKLMVRWLTGRASVAIIIWSMAAVSAVGSACLCWVVPGQAPVVPDGLAAWALLLATGLLAVGVQLSATNALRLCSAAPVVAMSYFAVIWGMGFDVLVFGDLPSALGLLGAALICACSAAVVLEQHTVAGRAACEPLPAARLEDGGGASGWVSPAGPPALQELVGIYSEHDKEAVGSGERSPLLAR